MQTNMCMEMNQSLCTLFFMNIGQLYMLYVKSKQFTCSYYIKRYKLYIESSIIIKYFI